MEWIDANLEKPPHEIEVLAYERRDDPTGKVHYYYYLAEWNADFKVFRETTEYREIEPDYWMYLPRPI